VFFAMELLVGEDLETRLRERIQNPIRLAADLPVDGAGRRRDGSVHAAGLIHRDLKPSNIFLSKRRDGREQVKLLDFGIVKSKDGAALTSTGAAIGTPFYMSPEQILAQELDHRTDIYSLGVLFFEALAGRMPFVGEAIQVAMQHCNVAPPTLRQVAPQPRHPRRARGAHRPHARQVARAARAEHGRRRPDPRRPLPIDTQSSLARPVTGRSNANAAAQAAAQLSASQEFSSSSCSGSGQAPDHRRATARPSWASPAPSTPPRRPSP
jgi:serine/threonine protein kinase